MAGYSSLMDINDLMYVHGPRLTLQQLELLQYQINQYWESYFGSKSPYLKAVRESCAREIQKIKSKKEFLI